MERIELYRSMARQRAVEMALAELWHRGLAPGEMHLGTGEEALVAGVCAHHGAGDGVAADHRFEPLDEGRHYARLQWRNRDPPAVEADNAVLVDGG